MNYPAFDIHTAPAPPSPDDTLASVWTRSAARYGNRIALRADGEDITYRALDKKARAFAVSLSQGGLGAGDICGVHLERSIDYVISILAVTLTGAAWLPLDPLYPTARLRHMAEDAKIQHLVGHADTPPLALNPPPRMYSPNTTVTLSTQAKNFSPTNARDRAYVIYTSGSSGEPKGIEIEHRSLIAFLEAMRELLPPEALEQVFAVTSPSFDISLLEMLLPLVCGGTVTLASATEARDGRLLSTHLQEERPSLLQATPATWRMLLAAGWTGHEQLTLLTGGEAIAPPMARELIARADSVWNLYGPTEATVWATASNLTEESIGSRSVPIGIPLSHADICILDGNDEPISGAEAGELCLLGPCLARGYLNQPSLSAEKFITLPQGRAYRTGDRVSRRPDGQLAFHGRVDRQIKLNGFRIEPAEVESVLSTHPEVQEAVVDVKTIDDNDSRLVAYIVPETFDPGLQRRQRLAEHWRTIWSQEYDAARSKQTDLTFNTAGLRSSYDGAPIPEAELRDIVEQSFERVKAFAPKRILDLGCGGGLMLFPLAPSCEQYTGVDFSPQAIAGLERETNRLGLSNVTLLEQSVDDPSNIEAGDFDAVVLNTVIQYFPDTDYLTTVLDNALRALRPGGVIFLGDVRELGALDAFHAAVLRANADDQFDATRLREELRSLAGRETELVFDPGWFEDYASSQPSLTAVEIAYKEGIFRNEVIDFRYDVVLRKGGAPTFVEPDLIHACAADETGLEPLWTRLAAQPEACVLVKNIPNTRRQDAFAFHRLLQANCNGEYPGPSEPPAYNPGDVVCKGRALGYEVTLLPDRTGSPEHFAALLVKNGPGVTIWSHRPKTAQMRHAPAQLSNALQQSLAVPGQDHKSLIGDLQQRTASSLPGAMCPAHYVILRELPLTPARKVDRHALPLPLNGRPDLPTAFLPPRDALEMQLANIIGDILGVSSVGARDGFFDLGGDSLATVELLLAIEDALGVSVELVHFLDAPTAEGLAILINEQREFRPATALVTLRPDGTGEPLFFIHGAGGLAFTVFELGQALATDRPVFAVQDPACDPSVEPARTIESMATALIGQIFTVQPSGHYHLCGHSFGGLLAYEMAVQLKAKGQEIAFLGMLDTPTPPKATEGDGVGARARLWRRELRFLSQILTQAGPMAADGCYVLFGAEARYHNRNEEARSVPGLLRGLWANVLFRYFHRRAGLASAVERDSRLLMLRQPGIRRAIRLTGIHDAARRHYRPQCYDGTIHLIRAETVSAETQGFPDKTLGWNRLASHVDIQRSPGSHFTMTRGENAKHLAVALERALKEAQH
ncbi:MAG: amino acid adenylation domain-containing protein [Alphaproteobacteria bacterium]|nr:amino acid adenylation domain-containing protein [Alphaproteobacteria bacterium]